MKSEKNILYTLNTRILLVLLALFIIIAGIIGAVNTRNIRNLYEESYTERLLLTNALMGSLIDSEDVKYFVELMRDQGEGFKRRQEEFYETRSELFRLQEEGASEEEQQALLDRLAVFHAETSVFKNEVYWDTLDALKNLKKLSNSTYVYVMADTGLHTADGEPLYTYIFDAEDEGEYSTPEMDGLGTSDTGIQEFQDVFTTKKQTETAVLYEGDFGTLYFVCVPILDKNNEVVAILGTDLSLEDMNSAIKATTTMFNGIIIAVFLVSVLVIFLLLRRSIGKPLGSLTQTALIFAEGNLHTPISESALKQRTEIGTLAHAFKSTLDATTLYLNSVPASLFIMNRDCETYFRNESFIKRFGDMQAREFMSVLYPGDTGERLEENLKNENNSMTIWLDGSCFAVMLKEIVLQNMPENSILVIANDITDLARETENAQAAAKAKSNFLSRMSHEMRTPMNAIIGMAKIAEDSDSVPNIKHCISVINASSAQLLGIINDILDMSKIEAGKLELSETSFRLQDLIDQVTAIMDFKLNEKHQNFTVHVDDIAHKVIVTDRQKLAQIITNLLSNANKFTPDGGNIDLRIHKSEDSGDHCMLLVEVEDDGAGISEEQQQRLFNAFEQANNTIARQYGGTGLGLAISKNIANLMNGDLWVESELGKGSVFRATIRVGIQEPSDGHDPGAVPSDDEDITGIFAGKRILLADDVEINRDILIALLEDTGVQIDCAENGVEVCDKFAACPEMYDLIFMDIHMPEMDGYEATGRIREMDVPGARSIPIVAMTADVFSSDIEKCLAAGIDDHVGKPLDIHTVIAKMKRYLL